MAKKFKLSPPWITFYHDLNEMFGNDPDIKLEIDEDEYEEAEAKADAEAKAKAEMEARAAAERDRIRRMQEAAQAAANQPTTPVPPATPV